MTVRDAATRRIRSGARITAINLRAQADFRVDFVASILDGALWQTSAVVFASVLLVRFAGIGDWASSAVLLLAAMRLTSHGLVTLVFGRILFLAFLLQEGRIDTYLTRPMSVYRQIQYSRFSANAIGDLAVAVTMLVVALRVFELPWTLARIGLLVGGILGGASLEAAVTNALAGLTLIVPYAAGWSFRFIELLSTVGNYPLTILPAAAQLLLTFVVPIGFIAYLPAAAITGHTDSILGPPLLAYCAPLVGLAAYLLSRLVWNACLDRYQGANS